MNPSESLDPVPVINGASSLEVVRGPGYRWNSLRRGEKPQLILQRTLGGEGRVRVGRETHVVGEGQVLIVAVPEDAEYWFDGRAAREWSFQWINMAGLWVQRQWLELRRRFGPAPRLDPRGVAAREFSLLAADFSANRLQERRAQAQACYGLLLEFWLELEGLENSPPSGHAALRQLIRLRHREQVNIKQLCAEVGQSREHLTRTFREAWGVEPGGWLRALRVEAAETQLRHGTASFEEIARRVGFSSGRQLARAFRAVRGVSPATYRASQSVAMGQGEKRLLAGESAGAASAQVRVC